MRLTSVSVCVPPALFPMGQLNSATLFPFPVCESRLGSAVPMGGKTASSVLKRNGASGLRNSVLLLAPQLKLPACAFVLAARYISRSLTSSLQLLSLYPLPTYINIFSQLSLFKSPSQP